MKWFVCVVLGFTIILATLVGHSEDDLLIFAVVTEVPKDKSRVTVKASINDVASETKLLASDTILSNLIWKKKLKDCKTKN